MNGAFKSKHQRHSLTQVKAHILKAHIARACEL